MKICGVVSEFNPFHNGHKYLISQIKNMGFDAVVCVMSGNFVQRGEYAVCDKRVRAGVACENGADLVLSLPFPWSSAPAELFASGAVSILCALGCVDAIAFGSESGDVQLLKGCAEELLKISVNEIIEFQKKHPDMSFARARQELVRINIGEKYSQLLESPNDILGIEYIKALISQGSSITPICVKRVGASHDGEVFADNIASSSKIRELCSLGKRESAVSFMPCSDSFLNNYVKADNERLFNILCGSILSRNPAELSRFAEIGGGFEYVLYREMLLAKNYDELFSALSAKHLTASKIRRALLFAALGVEKKSVSALPGFTEVLACTDIGKEILSDIRKTSEILVLSKVGNIKNASESVKEQFKLQRKAEMIFDKIICKLD